MRKEITPGQKRYIRHLYFEMEIHPSHREKYRYFDHAQAIELIYQLENERGIDKLSPEDRQMVREVMSSRGYDRRPNKTIKEILSGGFIVTDEWIEVYKTDNGGYTKSQIRALGVGMTRGWKARAIGKMISDENRKRFEDAEYSKKTKSMRRKESEQVSDNSCYAHVKELDSTLKSLVSHTR